MNRAGMSAPCIAYNEHGFAPRTSVLGRTDGARIERRMNRNAAKRARCAAAAYVGPRQPAPEAPRRRSQIRALFQEGKRAAKRGDTATVRRITTALNALLQVRKLRAGES